MAEKSSPTGAAGPSRRKPKAVAPEHASSVTQSSAPVVNVGQRLRTLRDEQGLSLRALAEKSSLATNTLSQIENGKTSPSVSTLQQIAGALDVPMMAFFEVEDSHIHVAHTKAGRRPRAAFAHGILEDLSAGMAQHKVEPFIVILEPHAGSGSQPIVHTGYEFFYCLQGRFTYTIGERTYLLEPGDSLLFESHLPHHWQNVEAEPSRAILVLYPTDERDRPTERHFAKQLPSH